MFVWHASSLLLTHLAAVQYIWDLIFNVFMLSVFLYENNRNRFWIVHIIVEGENCIILDNYIQVLSEFGLFFCRASHQ